MENQNQELRRLVVTEYQRRSNELRQVMAEWQEPRIMQAEDPDEWNRINDGLKSDLQAQIDYTNKFLADHGLELLSDYDTQ